MALAIILLMLLLGIPPLSLREQRPNSSAGLHPWQNRTGDCQAVIEYHEKAALHFGSQPD